MKKFLSIFILMIIACLFFGCDMISNQTKDNNDDGDDNGNTAGEKLEVSQTESEQKFDNLAKTGYELTFIYTTDDGEIETDTMTIGVTENIVWYITDNDGAAFVEEGNKVHWYSYSDGVYSFEYTLTNEGDESYADVYKTMANPWLYFANAYDGSLKKGADASVAGRSCYTYNLDLGALGGAYAGIAGIQSLKYKIYVDKELGITMKIELSATVEGQKSSFSYEVTSFKTGSSVKAPTLPEPIEVED